MPCFYANWNVRNMFVDSLHNQIILNFTNLHSVCNTTFKGALAYNGTSFSNLDGGMNTHDTIAKNTSFNAFSSITYGNKTLYGGLFQSLGSNKLFSQSLGLWNGTKWDTFPKKAFTYKPNFGNTPSIIGLYKAENKLWIYGIFDSIGGIACKNICTFDGTTFTPINIPVQSNFGIKKIIKYKDEIYMCGGLLNFPKDNYSLIVRYNYQTNTWNSVGSGIATSVGGVYDMAVYNDTLYIAGLFNKADGNTGNYIMKWDGNQFYDAGFGNYYGTWNISQLLVHKSKLYAFGNFIYAGDKTARNAAFYQNGKWTPNTDSINSGLSGAVILNDAIYISGAFTEVKGDTSLKYFVKLRCPNFDNCPPPEIITEPILPQLITANGDNINDEIIIQLPNTQNATLQVFNRWGNLVYKNKEANPNNNTPLILKWNGTYDSKPLPTGTYFYVVESINLNNESKNYRQFVELIR